MAKQQHRQSKPDASNKYASLARPQLTLDFHKAGILTRQEITALTQRFLERCRDKGLTKVMIITGKGLHSQDGQAVIKPLVEAILRRSEHVKTCSWAPINRGGDGAFEINLL